MEQLYIGLIESTVGVVTRYQLTGLGKCPVLRCFRSFLMADVPPSLVGLK